jgi:hypothetical protein
LQLNALNRLFLELGMFNFDPVIAQRQCPELEKAFLICGLFSLLVSCLIYQSHVNMDEDAAGGILNSPTNDTGGGLREHKRRHSKIRKNPEDQLPSHVSPPSSKVTVDSGNHHLSFSSASTGWNKKENHGPTFHRSGSVAHVRFGGSNARL